MAWYGHLAALLFIAREQSMTNHHLNILVFSRPKSANKVYTYYTCVCVCVYRFSLSRAFPHYKQKYDFMQTTINTAS